MNKTYMSSSQKNAQHKEEEVGTESHPLTKNIFIIDGCWKWSKVILVYQPYSKEGLVLRT